MIYCGDGAVPAGMHGYEALLAATEPVPDAVRRGEDLAGIFYTGGTTGFPKGVMLSHTNMCSSAPGAACRRRWRRRAASTCMPRRCSTWPTWASRWPHWIEGNTHTIIPAFNPEAVLDAIERDRVTHILLVPTMIQMTGRPPGDAEAARPERAARRIIYGASPISEAVLDARDGGAARASSSSQAYGMTELSPVATVNPRLVPHGRGPQARQAALGRPRQLSAPRCASSTPTATKCRAARSAKSSVRGPNVMQGYWNKPEQTAAALRDGWMHTGDGAYMDDDGFIFIADRLKDMIITGGENVYSAEVENALAQHPAVAACAVIGVPSEEWGEAVHAVVVRKPGSDVAADELIAHCKTLIAGYKCPRSIALRRCAAAVGRRQGAQDQAARALLARPRARRRLTFASHRISLRIRGVLHEP